MRRSICYCEPTLAEAGEDNTWKFIFTPSTNLPKGTKLKFDMMTKGRDIDWEIPTSNLKKTKNVIYGLVGNKVLPAKEVVVKDSFAPHFEFTLPAQIDAGDNFTVIVGSPKLNKSMLVSNGTKAQNFTQRRRTFQLYVDTTGKGRYDDPETFNMDIRGGELKTIRILTPSFVAKNRRFDIVLRFEDEFGNLTNNAHEETLIELSYENIRENLNWKLFVPETGFITLPNLYFNEAGTYTICLHNAHTKEVFRSCPIKCFPDNNRHIFWGLLHGESDKYDSTENIDSCLRHFRDERALNFYGASPFENAEETSNELWKSVSQNITEFNEDDRFSTFLGVQYEGAPTKEGVRFILYAKDQKQILRQKEAKFASLDKVYKSFSPKEIISIPTFTMGKGYDFDFKAFNPDYERVVEIYNAWGSSEMTKKEGNTRPISGGSKTDVNESAEGAVQKALLKNCRFGFVGGGLDDRGIYAPFFEGDQVQYTPGMTAIIAQEHNRASMLEALYNRSCYATTGERIIVGLYLAGASMGKEITTADKPGLLINRHLTGYVAGTAKIKTIEIIRNGKVIKTFEPENYFYDFEYDDLTDFNKVSIDAKDKKPQFIFYYVRVTQEDGHMAWSSPIWVDFMPAKPVPKKVIKPVAAKPAPVKIEDDFDDEDDFSDFDDDE